MTWLFQWIGRILKAFVVALSLSLREVPPADRKFIALFTILPGAFLIGYVFHIALEIGRADSTPPGQTRFIGALSIGAVLIAGRVLFWLRENRRFTYGCLELSAAMATAFHAVAMFSTSQERMPSLVAYLGALYIAVRGYDNLQKALDEYQR